MENNASSNIIDKENNKIKNIKEYDDVFEHGSKVRYKKKNEKKIYDPKRHNRFKFIFGPNNQHIMKRLLTDFLPFTFDEDQKMVYIQPTLTSNEYIDNEKRPIVNINVEIGTKDVLKKVEENRQASLQYSKKKDRKGKNDKKKAKGNKKNKNKNDNGKGKGKEGEEEEKEKLKRIIVEMQVYDDKDFSRNIVINAMNSYTTYCTSSKYKEIVDVYSLNFIYNDLFKDKKNNNSSKSKNSKYVHNLYFNDPSDYEEYCLPNIHIFIVELSKFDINNFNEDDAKDLWTAFFKCITYKIEYNKKRKYEGDPKTVKIILNDLPEDLYKKLSKIDEIKEAIDKINVDKEYYKNYLSSVLNDEKVLTLERKNEELENENNAMKTQLDAMQTKMDATKNENNAMKTQLDAMKTRMDGLEGENKDIKSKYESLIKELEELKNQSNNVNN